MIIQCCYCKKIIGEKEPLDDKTISHGCCTTCEDEQMLLLDKMYGKDKPLTQKEE